MNENSINFKQNFLPWAQGQLAQAESGYQSAITYYQNLKRQFISDMTKTQQDSVDLMAEQFITDINNQFISGEDEVFTEEKIREFYEEIEKYIDQIISIGLLSQGKAISKISTKTYGKNIKKEYKGKLDSTLVRLKAELSDVVLTNTHLKQDLNFIFQSVFGQQMNQNIQLQSSINLVKRALLDRLNNGKFRNEILSSNRMQGYKNLFRGYYSEEAKTELLNKSKELLQNNWGAAQTGELIGNNQQQSVYDIILGKGINKNTSNQVLQQLIDNLDLYGQGLWTDAEVELYNPIDSRHVYGIQSKLWLLPDENTKLSFSGLDAKWYKIGNRAELLNNIGGGILHVNYYTWLRGWHHNVNLLSNYLTTALGQGQVMYGVRDKFLWTGDLINTMHQAGYWVSFYYSRREGKFFYPIQTGELIWDVLRFQYANAMRKSAALRRKK